MDSGAPVGMSCVVRDPDPFPATYSGTISQSETTFTDFHRHARLVGVVHIR